LVLILRPYSVLVDLLFWASRFLDPSAPNLTSSQTLHGAIEMYVRSIDIPWDVNAGYL
jgi:hypothetical protein